MSMLERAMAHYAELREEKRFVEVPQWKDDAGNPAKIYYTPMTINDQKRIRTRANGDSTEMCVWTLIYKAEDETGQKIFKPGDHAHLVNGVDSTIIAEVAVEILGGTMDADADLVQEAEKN